MNGAWVSLDAAVSRAQVICGLKNNEFRAEFRGLAYDGMLELGWNYGNLTTSELLPINGCVIEKPCDFLAIVCVVLKCGDQCVVPCYKNGGIRCGCYANGRSNSGITVSERLNSFYLSSDANEVAWDGAILEYWRINVGEDGLPIIKQDWVYAIAFWIKWMFNEGEHQSKGFRRVPRGQINDAMNKFLAFKRQSIGRDNMPNAMEMGQLGVMNLDMVPGMGGQVKRWIRGRN